MTEKLMFLNLEAESASGHGAGCGPACLRILGRTNELRLGCDGR